MLKLDFGTETLLTLLKDAIGSRNGKSKKIELEAVYALLPLVVRGPHFIGGDMEE